MQTNIKTHLKLIRLSYQFPKLKLSETLMANLIYDSYEAVVESE